MGDVSALALLAHLAGQGLVAFGVGRLSASLAAVILCLEGVGAMTSFARSFTQKAKFGILARSS